MLGLYNTGFGGIAQTPAQVVFAPVSFPQRDLSPVPQPLSPLGALSHVSSCTKSSLVLLEPGIGRKAEWEHQQVFPRDMEGLTS